MLFSFCVQFFNSFIAEQWKVLYKAFNLTNFILTYFSLCPQCPIAYVCIEVITTVPEHAISIEPMT